MTGCWRSAQRLEGWGPVLEDRAEVIPAGDSLLLVVADGAGGLSGGAEAAELVVRLLRERAHHEQVGFWSGDDWTHALREIDDAVANDPVAGEATCVVALVSPGRVVGASAGDSEAWLVEGEGCVALTGRQRRKPLLGSGAAWPVPFEAGFHAGTLLLGSDGLFKYAAPKRIREAALDPDLERAADRLVELVRLPSGALQDDVAVILCRV
jgi:PPM family protein phosphatase